MFTQIYEMMFIGSVLIIIKSWEKLVCPSICDWVNKNLCGISYSELVSHKKGANC